MKEKNDSGTNDPVRVIIYNNIWITIEATINDLQA